jgi:hypothetical protein
MTLLTRMLEMGVARFDSVRGWADLTKTDGCSLFQRQTNILVSGVESFSAVKYFQQHLMIVPCGI